MEENSIVKYEGGLINRIGNQIGVTNKLLALNLRQLNILHLDDHILYHKGILKCVIEKFPYVNVKHIQNGDTALEYVINCFKNNKHIDLIITDIAHLGLNGIEFSFAVRDSEKESAKKIPILFITMIDDKSIQEKVKQLPSVMYLLKTSKCEEINCAIENLLSQSSDKIIVE